MATKEKVTLMLTTKEVSNAVKSWTFSKHYTAKMIRISVLNIMYRRIAIDESQFEQKKYEQIPYVLVRSKCTDKMIRHFHGVSRGIVDTVENGFLKEVWVFIKEKETNNMENYVFHLNYTKNQKAKSSVTAVEIRQQTLSLLEALFQLASDKKYQPEEIKFSVELKYTDGVPPDYNPPFFEDSLNPYCLTIDKKSSCILGTVNTGYHKMKCLGTGKFFSASRSVSPAPSVAGQKRTQEDSVLEILDDSRTMIEGEEDRFSETAETVFSESLKKKQKSDESDCHEFEAGNEESSNATGCELITCCCEWDLPSDQYELIKCSRCECYVHAVCHGYLEKKLADEVTFQCYACTGEIIDKWTPKMRVVLFYMKETKKLPLKISQIASRLEYEELLSKLSNLGVFKKDRKNKSTINTEALNKSIADMFRLADSQFFD